MEGDRDISYLGDIQPIIRKKFKACLRVSDRFKSLFEARKSNLNPLTSFLFLNPAKEVFVGFGKSVRTVLNSLGENSVEFWVRVFDLFDDIVKFVSATERNLVGFVCGLTPLKKKIIHLTTQAKVRIQSPHMVLGGIQSKFIVPEFHYVIYQYSKCLYGFSVYFVYFVYFGCSSLSNCGL